MRKRLIASMPRRRYLRTAVAVLTFATVAAACSSSSKQHGAGTVPPTSGTTSTTTTTTSLPATTTTRGPAAGTWSLIPAAPNPLGKPIVWTGNELLAAKAGCCDDLGSVDLVAYDPSTGAWHKLPPTPLTPREGAAAAWTGTEMVVAGGRASADGTASRAVPVTDGAAWTARTNSWHRIAPMPATLAGSDPTAVWTGHEMLVWSSVPADPTGREVVLAYNPSTDSWRTLPSSGLEPRAQAVTVWTGKELVVWSGRNIDFTATLGDGARLDPATGIWRRLPPAPVPARVFATGTWSGREMLLWGGNTGSGAEVGKGAAYNPSTNSWRALPPSPLRAKTRPASMWTGRLFIVMGGSTLRDGLPVPGPGAAAYDPSTNSWTALPGAPPYAPAPNGPTFAADQRDGATAIWTGRAVLLVGGSDQREQIDRSDGIAWTPAG